jgi:hypothetical protein
MSLARAASSAVATRACPPRSAISSVRASVPWELARTICKFDYATQRGRSAARDSAARPVPVIPAAPGAGGSQPPFSIGITDAGHDLVDRPTQDVDLVTLDPSEAVTYLDGPLRVTGIHSPVVPFEEVKNLHRRFISAGRNPQTDARTSVRASGVLLKRGAQLPPGVSFAQRAFKLNGDRLR